MARNPKRLVLNVGAGPRDGRPLHPAFDPSAWTETRVDIDAHADPDIVASIIDMQRHISSARFDAVWSSHVLEHLHAHDVPLALAEYRRVLRPTGFALVTSPDLEVVARIVLEHGLDHVAYTAPAGPITALDMLFGHSDSIAQGNVHMAHRTGFTCAALAEALLDAGFATVLAKSVRFDLWVVALMERADTAAIQEELKSAGLDMVAADD